MNIEHKDRTALITASSRGIGFGVAKVLAMDGADVILVSRSRENLEKAKTKIKEVSSSEVYTIQTDLTVKNDLEKIAEFTDELGGVDIFFFSTGGPPPGYFMETKDEDWEIAIKLLLYPAVFLSRHVAEHMVEREWGRIVILTSTAIKEPIPNIALSNVVRISLAGLVKTLAKELGRYNITVNGIMPGLIKTDRIINLAKDRATRENREMDAILEEFTASIPVGRLGEAEEIGYLVSFLCSDFASYINGAMIPVDGGKLNSVF